MDFKYINVSQICSIEGKCISRNRAYQYKEYKSASGIFPFRKKEVKEGFYEWGYDEQRLRSVLTIESEGNIVIGKKVFSKPFLIVKMSNGDTHRKTFDRNQDMFEFLCKSPLVTLNLISTKKTLQRREVLLEKYQGYSDEYRILLKRSLETDNNQ